MFRTAWSWVERVLEAVMATFLLAMALITAIDVVGRYFFSAPLPGGYEIVQYLMALSVFAALPLTTQAEGHLTISMLTDRLGPRTQRVQRVIMLFISTLVLAFLAWRMGVQANHLSHGTALSGSLGIPLAPVAYAMTVLAWLAVAVSAVLVVQAISGKQPSGRKPEETIE
ncbi:TRAP transporter small permease [Phaeobacter sp. HF9A]|uniref:TRAP transporter small permease n=1 Tax=Phaeobacter sp. HF9A TaxID=2721561 RepID=UPI00143026CA|nr:TRAP transporter small permease [Phaeobacter sp. HF9A]NIZ14461.1 TRAP transporter small permease [Phaeobacter sp. HF9A]